MLNDDLCLFMGHYLIVSKWRPNFRPAFHTIASPLLWVCFPQIPIKFFQKDFLLRLGNLVGKAVNVDFITMAATRGKFACMCVEVDLNKPLVYLITVMGILPYMEYEGLYHICFGCGRYGHKQELCPSEIAKTREGPEVHQTEVIFTGSPSIWRPVVLIIPSTVPAPILEDGGFGPWMISKRLVRRGNLEKGHVRDGVYQDRGSSIMYRSVIRSGVNATGSWRAPGMVWA